MSQLSTPLSGSPSSQISLRGRWKGKVWLQTDSVQPTPSSTGTSVRLGSSWRMPSTQTLARQSPGVGSPTSGETKVVTQLPASQRSAVQRLRSSQSASVAQMRMQRWSTQSWRGAQSEAVRHCTMVGPEPSPLPSPLPSEVSAVVSALPEVSAVVSALPSSVTSATGATGSRCAQAVRRRSSAAAALAVVAFMTVPRFGRATGRCPNTRAPRALREAGGPRRWRGKD